MKKKWFVVSAALCTAALVGCASTRGVVASAVVSAKAEKTANDQRVVDWKNRGIGEIASPEWLLPAARGDWKLFKADWNVPAGKKLNLITASHSRRNAAMTVTELQYASNLAKQLKDNVMAALGRTMESNSEFDTVNDVATKTQVTIAGQERLTDFWNQTETTDERGRKVTEYHYYIVYACDEAIWDEIVAKYLLDIIGQVPEKKTQKVIRDMFKEIDAATKNEKPVSEAQFKRELAAQEEAIARGGLSKDEQRAAYRSGDPVRIAAAGATSADKGSLAALMALDL